MGGPGAESAGRRADGGRCGVNMCSIFDESGRCSMLQELPLLGPPSLAHKIEPIFPHFRPGAIVGASVSFTGRSLPFTGRSLLFVSILTCLGFFPFDFAKLVRRDLCEVQEARLHL